MPSAKVTAILAHGTAGAGMLQPDEGGAPLTFTGANSQAGDSASAHNLTFSDVGSTVTYNAVGDRAVKVKFTT